MQRILALVAAMALAVTVGQADDWPQWRGPNRDGVSKEAGLLKSWPKGGPKLLWTYRQAGAGYSCPAVVGDRLYTLGARDAEEYLICLDIKDPKTIKELWAVKVGPTFNFDFNQWGVGPRATPTVDGNLVFGLGGQGELVCVTTDGKEQWRKSMPKHLNGQVNPEGGGPENIGWGYTWSPLVDGEQLICTPGGPDGTVAALDKKTGKVLWRSKEYTQQCSYASPILADVGGIRHYVILTYDGATGVSRDGKVLWHYPKKPPYNEVLMATPIFRDSCVFITGLKNSGCDLIRLTAKNGAVEAKRAYANKNVTTGQGNVVPYGDSIYAYSEGPGWVCQDFKTGKLNWKEKNALGRGTLSAADGCLYLVAEDYEVPEGPVVLLEASKDEWKEKGRLSLPEKTQLLDKKSQRSGKRWTPPVIANGKLLLRDQELIFCYDIKQP
jgi:outer membrane protein assembly factor BamB